MKRFCGAKTRQGTYCKKAPLDNGRCRLHGGLTPIKHGRYSKAQGVSVGELLLRNSIEEVFRAITKLDSYLDETTRAGLEQALERYCEATRSSLFGFAISCNRDGSAEETLVKTQPKDAMPHRLNRLSVVTERGKNG